MEISAMRGNLVEPAFKIGKFFERIEAAIEQPISMYEPITRDIKKRVFTELIYMAYEIQEFINANPFFEIYNHAKEYLDLIGNLIQEKKIEPRVNIRVSDGDTEKPVIARPIRIGFYPVAANPFHWAHLLCGLSAIAKFKLDKVIYVIAGDDPRKPGILPAEIRHRIGEETLKAFSPLLEYSPISLGTSLDGETSLFKTLHLNPHQRIDAFYIVGTDHYHRINPLTKTIDTIQKLEDNILNKVWDFNEEMHSVSAIFVERGTREHTIETFLNVEFIPSIQFAASSTMIRETLKYNSISKSLAIMPYTVYRNINKLNLYRSSEPHL